MKTPSHFGRINGFNGSLLPLIEVRRRFEGSTRGSTVQFTHHMQQIRLQHELEWHSLECTSRHGQRTCTDDGSSIAGRERSSTLKKPSLRGGLLCQIWPFGMSMFKNLLPHTMCRVLQIKSLRLCPVSHNFLQICPQLLGVILFADGVLPCVRLFFLEKLVILAIYYEIVVLKFFLLMFLPVSVDHK